MSSDNKKSAYKLIAQNKKARHSYFIEEEFEAGIVLLGSEVKSLRAGEANINDSYAEVKDGEAFMVNSYIKEYEGANRFNHTARRVRKLLLHRREINKLMAAVQKKGMTLVTLKLYFDDHNRAKVLIGLGKGKKMHDKRNTVKDRDWSREQGRLLKNNYR